MNVMFDNILFFVQNICLNQNELNCHIGFMSKQTKDLFSLSLVRQILESDKRITLGQNDTGFSCDGTATTFRVMFKEPVEILPNVSYTACATLKVGRRLLAFCSQLVLNGNNHSEVKE